MIFQRTDLVFAACQYREFSFSGEWKFILENDIVGLTVAWCKKATNTEFLLVFKPRRFYHKPPNLLHFIHCSNSEKSALKSFLEVGFFGVFCLFVCLIPFQTTCSMFPFAHSLDIIAPIILLLIIQIYSFYLYTS